mmetsp:Transcript_41169/g.82506  ORF Transcript_41169/g.82506 Transcript_41169/m.82506 type:complete len:206 (-) Transcript_41169:485-1102(-)
MWEDMCTVRWLAQQPLAMRRLRVCGGQQTHTAENPLARSLLSAQLDREDKVEPRPLGVLVARAFVRRRASAASANRSKLARDVQHWQRREEHLGVGIGELIARLVPFGALEVEAMKVAPLVGPLAHLLLLLPQHVRSVDDVVERPTLLCMFAAHLLAICREESLGVEESGQPKGCWPALHEPARQLVSTLHDVGEPHARIGRVEL